MAMTEQGATYEAEGALPAALTEQVEERQCAHCEAPATHVLVYAAGETPMCWRHNTDGADVGALRAAWRRFNAAEGAIRQAFEDDDSPTAAERREREAAKAEIEAAAKHEALHLTCARCGELGDAHYCESCDNTRQLPNDEAENEHDPLYKPCPVCVGACQFISYGALAAATEFDTIARVMAHAEAAEAEVAQLRTALRDTVTQLHVAGGHYLRWRLSECEIRTCQHVRALLSEEGNSRR